MDAMQFREGLDRVEQCAEDAKRAAQAGSAPDELRQCVDTLHQHARDAKQKAGTQGDEGAMRSCMMDLEQAADRAMQACRDAGSQVDAQTQQAVQRAHAEASTLKHHVQAGSPA